MSVEMVHDMMCCNLCHNKLMCNVMRHYNLKIYISSYYFLSWLTEESLEQASRRGETKKIIAFFYHKMHLYFHAKTHKPKKVCGNIVEINCAMLAASIYLTN